MPEFEPFGAIPSVDHTDDLVILGGTPTPVDGGSTTSALDGGPGAWGSDPVSTPRRRIPWRLMLPLLVVVALVGLGVLAWQLFRTPASTPSPTWSVSRNRSPGTRSPGTGGR